MPWPEPQPTDRSSPFERLGTAATITLAGAGAYGTLPAIYAIYYGLLGSTPEQVGLGYVETLSQGAFALAGVLALGAAGWFLLTHMFTPFNGKLAWRFAELANEGTWVAPERRRVGRLCARREHCGPRAHQRVGHRQAPLTAAPPAGS